jgi:VWFA-related protein
MYDTVADAVPLAAQGSRQKKAVVLISDGNDTSSNTPLADLQQLIRESEVLVYAIGIDSNTPVDQYTPYKQPPPRPAPQPGNRAPSPIPQPFPPLRPRGPGYIGISYVPDMLYISSRQTAQPRVTTASDHVNVAALRDLTDDSGGRTEIIRDARDLNPATANIADELSKQYYLGYPSTGKKDGRWHAIRVALRNKATYRVRARRGYIAS